MAMRPYANPEAKALGQGSAPLGLALVKDLR
jgi:hypothetical protein